MLNLTGMLKAPNVRQLCWVVTMNRCHTSNAYENSRSRVAYVMAANDKDAMLEAKRQYPQFHPVSVRRES